MRTALAIIAAYAVLGSVAAVLVGATLRGCARRQSRPLADHWDDVAAQEPMRTLLARARAIDRWERHGGQRRPAA